VAVVHPVNCDNINELSSTALRRRKSSRRFMLRPASEISGGIVETDYNRDGLFYFYVSYGRDGYGRLFRALPSLVVPH
jgi:hypothetical protein